MQTFYRTKVELIVLHVPSDTICHEPSSDTFVDNNNKRASFMAIIFQIFWSIFLSTLGGINSLSRVTSFSEGIFFNFNFNWAKIINNLNSFAKLKPSCFEGHFVIAQLLIATLSNCPNQLDPANWAYFSSSDATRERQENIGRDDFWCEWSTQEMKFWIKPEVKVEVRWIIFERRGGGE